MLASEMKEEDEKKSVDEASKEIVGAVSVREKVVRVGNRLKVVRIFVSKGGNVIARTVSPLMTTFKKKDVAQVFIGSLLLATPFMVTEEVWNLGAQLSIVSTVSLVFLSLLSLVILNYYTRYQRVRTPEGEIPRREFIKRIFGTYVITLSIVATLLTILGKAPWIIDLSVAVKRTILVSLPASLGGSAADLVK
jgi:uncharacterized membrane protein